MATLASVDQNNYCNICFNNDSKLVSLCNNGKCNIDGKACVKCVEEYINFSLDGDKSNKTNFQFLKPIKCFNQPNCKCVIDYNDWKPYAAQKDLKNFHKSCKEWLSIRCTSCHTPHTLFVETSYKPIFKHVLTELVTMKKTTNSVQYILPNECSESLFIAYVNNEVNDNIFIEKVFGTFDKMKTDTTTKTELKERVEKQELIASQIISIDKRFRFQSQFYYTFRSCITSCTCKRRMCYYCKSNAHPGLTCEQNQNRSPHIGQVNACPRCGIAIVKQDGCDSVKCVCGHKFTWRKEFRFDNSNSGRIRPATIGTTVQGWLRTTNGWERAPPPVPTPAPHVVRQVTAMPEERFNNVRNRLQNLLNRRNVRLEQQQQQRARTRPRIVS